jgi:hypothetical protein
MKNTIIVFFCVSGFFFCSSFDYELQEKNMKNNSSLDIQPPAKKQKKKIERKIERKQSEKNFEIFADSLAMGESSNVVDTMNPGTGCVGLYQFCSNRAADFKLDTKSIRKMNKTKQKLLFKKHVKSIKKALGKKNYIILKKKGYSDGSIIAIAHLGGVTGLKKYANLEEYKGYYNPSDGNTKLSDYDAKYAKFDGFLSEI